VVLALTRPSRRPVELLSVALPSGPAEVAVGVGGVWLIERREWSGRALCVIEQAAEGAEGAEGRCGPESRLLLDAVDVTDVVERVRAGVVELCDVLGDEVFWAPVAGVLCVSGATWPRFSSGLRVGGVLVCWPRALPGLLGGRGPLERTDLERVVARLRSVSLPAARRAA